jgi:hypothetical protein
MNSNLGPKSDSLSAPDYILQNFEASDRIAVLVRSRIFRRGSGTRMSVLTCT